MLPEKFSANVRIWVCVSTDFRLVHISNAHLIWRKQVFMSTKHYHPSQLHSLQLGLFPPFGFFLPSTC